MADKAKPLIIFGASGHAKVVIGAGATVTGDVPDDATIVGSRLRNN